jgi:hypothetical protein
LDLAGITGAFFFGVAREETVALKDGCNAHSYHAAPTHAIAASSIGHLEERKDAFYLDRPLHVALIAAMVASER